MYIPRYFTLPEVLPEQFYTENSRYGNSLWRMFDDRILRAADILREMYGPIIINTWFSLELIRKYGKHQFRGWRPFDCKCGAYLSDHKFGRALDLVPLKTTAKKIRQDIKELPCEPFSMEQTRLYFYITCIEDDVSWLHISCRNHDKIKYGLQVLCYKPMLI